MRDEALAAARQAEQTVLRGGDVGPLFGVPVAVKDQFWTRGILTHQWLTRVSATSYRMPTPQ